MRGEFTDAVFVRVGRINLPEARRYWKIGEVSLLLGEEPITIRRWLSWHASPAMKIRRTRSGHRLFIRADVERLRVIQACSRMGISHEGIKTVLACHRWAWLDHQPAKENRNADPTA